MLRKIAVLALLVVVIAAAFASAANLTVDGGTIQAGVDQSVYCDANGVYVDGWGLETDDDTVRSVRIGDIDTACKGSEMFVKVLGANASVLFSGKVTVATPMHSFSFASPYLAPDKIEGIKIWIEGPGAVVVP